MDISGKGCLRGRPRFLLGIGTSGSGRGFLRGLPRFLFGKGSLTGYFLGLPGPRLTGETSFVSISDCLTGLGIRERSTLRGSVVNGLLDQWRLKDRICWATRKEDHLVASSNRFGHDHSPTEFAKVCLESNLNSVLWV